MNFLKINSGAACAWKFAALGSKLILVGRRQDRLKQLEKELLVQFPSLRVHVVPISVTDFDTVANLPSKLPVEFQAVEILVNNAGLALGVSPVDKNSVEDASTVINTNVLGTIAFCSAFIPGMIARNAGHVINMGSVAVSTSHFIHPFILTFHRLQGHYAYSAGSIYNASKYAITGFTEAARHDLIGTPIRVTQISPGMVRGTEFSHVRLKDASKAAAVYADIEALDPENVADNVIYVVSLFNQIILCDVDPLSLSLSQATRPPHVQIADIIVYATNQSGPKDIARVGPSLGGK